MNQHRVSDSSYTSVGGGRYSPRIGTGRSKSRTVGDVAFIHEGKPFITFYQIPDPHGVARLAKAASKRRLENIKTAEKINKARLQEQRRQATTPLIYDYDEDIEGGREEFSFLIIPCAYSILYSSLTCCFSDRFSAIT
jgi:hypothetical protein